jgi:hypothetical protein
MRYGSGADRDGIYKAAAVAVILAGLLGLAQGPTANAVDYEWSSPNRFRILLSVDPRGAAPRSHSPTGPARINFHQQLASAGGTGTFDEHTVEVMACEPSGQPFVYDASRTGYEKYLLPCRLDKYYGVDGVDLVFVMPDQNHLQYMVYFDSVESGLGRPDRYPGLVGDGDGFRQEYGRREIGPSKFGDLADFDGDGDLDLFEGGVEPFI